MKNALLFITAFITISAFAQAPVQTPNPQVSNGAKAHIKFDTTVIDFGKIKQGVPVEKNFNFTNTGDAPLIISSAHASCSCTVPHKPEAAILPGKEDFITAGFKAPNLGPFTKTITVNSNAEENNVVLTIKGEVVQ